jgi:hypothetical protein
MPSHCGPLAEQIAETLRLAKIKIEQLRIDPDEPQLFSLEPINLRILPQARSEIQPQTEAIFRAVMHNDLTEAAALLSSLCGDDSVALAICAAATSATVILDKTIDPEALETSLSIDLLEHALQAAQLWYIGDWKSLAPVLIELNTTESWLQEETEPNVSLVAFQREYPQIRPALWKLVQYTEAQSRASEESARRKWPKQQLRIRRFTDAMRANPDGGPKVWCAAVAQQEFGRSVALLHVQSLGRWLRLHRQKIEAALMADRPPDFPPVGPDQ